MNNNNKEIRLSDILMRLTSTSKLLLIVITTLLFSVSFYISASNQEVKHESKALIEIGSYNFLNSMPNQEFSVNTVTKLIESPQKLLDEINFQVKHNKEFTAPGSFGSLIISPKVIQLSIQSTSLDLNKKYLESLMKHIFDRHKKITSKINSQFLDSYNYSYETLSNNLEFKEQKRNTLLSTNDVNLESIALVMLIEDELTNLNIRLYNMNLAKNSIENLNGTNLIKPIDKITIYQNVKKSIITGMISGFTSSLFLVFIFATYSAYKEQEVQ